MLLMGEEPQYVDTDLRRDTKGPWRAIVVGGQRVVLAESDGLDDDATTTVRAWPRSALRRVEIAAGPDELNANAVWRDDYEDKWPKGAAVTLIYEGIESSVLLPLQGAGAGHVLPAVRKELLTILPGLLNDMG
jgi:hypothetical protein